MRVGILTALAAAAFAGIYLVTIPETTADTVVYVGQILTYYQRGSAASPVLLWEFGHLIWRPLGYGLWRACRPLLSFWAGDNPQLEITLALMGVNIIAGLLLILVLLLLTRRLGLGERAAVAVTASCLLCSTILNYIHSGMSYNLGLVAQMAALLILLKAVQPEPRATLFAVVSGGLLALSVCLWFPYVLTVPAVLLGGLILAPTIQVSSWKPTHERWRIVAVATMTTTVVGLTFFGIGAAIAGITTYAQFKQWIVNSAHGVAPDRRLIRLPAGVTRSFFQMGFDGLVMKRFTFGDPYAPVSLAGFVSASLWKVAVVFATAAGVFFSLVRRREAWPALAVVLCGVLPTVGFAVFLFDTSEPARYEPAYPSLIVGICAVLLLGNKARVTRILLICCAGLMILVNLRAYAWNLRLEASKSGERAMLVHKHTGNNGVALITSFRDPLSTYIQKHPFSPLNRQGGLPVADVIEPGTIQLPQWRSQAACRMLRAWDSGGEVWVSDRLMAPRPKAEWNWVEYDDRRVRWIDLPTFFSSFETDSHDGDADGFFRVARTPHNRENLLRTCAGSTASPEHTASPQAGR
jgi:hypothetical protein